MPSGIYPPDNVRRELRRVLLEHVGYGEHTASELYAAIADSSDGWWFSRRALALELSRMNGTGIKLSASNKLFITDRGNEELERYHAAA